MLRIPVGFVIGVYSGWRFLKAVFTGENPGRTVTVADLRNTTVSAPDGHWHVPPSAVGWLILFAIGGLMFVIPTKKERK